MLHTSQLGASVEPRHPRRSLHIGTSGSKTLNNMFYMFFLALYLTSPARKEINQDLSYSSLSHRQKNIIAVCGGGGKDAGHVPQRQGNTRSAFHWQKQRYTLVTTRYHVRASVSRQTRPAEMQEFQLCLSSALGPPLQLEGCPT